MKKRVSLELRHRSPTEVSGPVRRVVYRRPDRPEKEGWRAHGRLSAAPEKCQNVCLRFKATLRADPKSGRRFN